MSILSFQSEGSSQRFSRGGTSGDELLRFALSGTVFISLSFLKDSFSGKSPLAGRLFSPSTLSVSMEEARLLMVAGEAMRRQFFSRDAAVTAIMRVV